MSYSNKERVVAFSPKEGKTIKIESKDYQYLKGRGLAFHTSHPVTRLFKEVFENYKAGNSVYSNKDYISCYLPITMERVELKAPVFWALQGYNLAIKCDRRLIEHIKDIDNRKQLKEFAIKSLIEVANGVMIPNEEAFKQTRRLR